MSATDEVRRLLDERGVEWRERVWGGKHSVVTFWHARGVRWHYRENRFGELRLHADGLTPEQAIEATLGRGGVQEATLRRHNAMLRQTVRLRARIRLLEMQRMRMRVLRGCEVLHGMWKEGEGMSWSPDLFIGEFRPWPDTVHVVRGKTDEMRRYVPEEMLFHERDGHDKQFERARSLEDENVKLQDENARLRSCLSDDAENARMIMAENAKLRELVRHLRECTRHNVCAACEYADGACDFDYDLRELGVVK